MEERGRPLLHRALDRRRMNMAIGVADDLRAKAEGAEDDKDVFDVGHGRISCVRGKVAATGDFVLVKEEVDGVTKALAEHGILVTALHNHLVHGTPDLYFMHFWVHDSADKVAKGLRAGLDAMKQSKKES